MAAAGLVGPVKGSLGFGGGARGVKAAATGRSSPGLRSRLQFLLDIAQATFNQPAQPTTKQIEALRLTLSQVPLEELGMQRWQQQQQQQQGADSSSSSRSCSPGLSEGTHALLRGEPTAPAASPQPAAAAEAPRPPITYLLIYEDSRVSMGIFCLPARARIPLHNHPGMTVLSRVLYGQMRVRSYDWQQPGAAGGALPRAARTVVDAPLTHASQPVVLFPHSGGNMHEFTALTDCAVLDLMSPPYSTEDGRDCTYYSLVPGAHPQPGDSSVVWLADAEPPPDFVINQGQYAGVTPRVKARGQSPGGSPGGGGSPSPAASQTTAGGRGAADYSMASSKGSPRSEATTQASREALSRLLGGEGTGAESAAQNGRLG